MSQMLPEGGEVMRRVACGAAAPAPAPSPPQTHRSENKELLRQQLLSAKERQNNNAEKQQETKQKHPRNRQKNRWKLKFHHQALPQEYLDHYEQSLQKQARLKNAAEKSKAPEIPNQVSKENFKHWTQKLTGHDTQVNTNSNSALNMSAKSPKIDTKKKTAIAPNKIVTYDDLPYMGELTLNNTKPRRGRKPKKADICHLIYENYGTVVPGQPITSDNRNLANLPFRNESLPKTDLQNRIISSLLERKLSHDKRQIEASQFVNPNAPMPEAPMTIAGPLHSDDEPLNLCIRDLHELKIQIQKKFGNIYSSVPEVKIELDEDMKSQQSNAISVIQRNTNLDSEQIDINQNQILNETATSEGGGCNVYWPNALYMHPLAFQTQLMYYQRLAASGQLPFPVNDLESTPSTPNTPETPTNIEETKNKLVLKEISELLDPVRQNVETKSPEPKLKRASPNPTQGPVKRKRSAIFIPSVTPKTNSTTPSAEVSICKFKFTGGLKPTLQEKKMLSVDAGGNFRYYNGIGNKNAKPVADSNPSRSLEPVSKFVPETSTSEDLSKKKRKSRKSLQREKLEQTFKEKGFLIQTQQLQSAEGATYCKFRQLRKFTRYLFRSWKDYLPGELNERGSEVRVDQQLPPAHSNDVDNNQLPSTSEWG